MLQFRKYIEQKLEVGDVGYIWYLTDIGSIAQRVPPDQGEPKNQAEYIR